MHVVDRDEGCDEARIALPIVLADWTICLLDMMEEKAPG